MLDYSVRIPPPLRFLSAAINARHPFWYGFCQNFPLPGSFPAEDATKSTKKEKNEQFFLFLLWSVCGWVEVCVDGWKYVWMGGSVCGWVEVCVDGWKCVWMVKVCVDGWKCVWVGVCVDGMENSIVTSGRPKTQKTPKNVTAPKSSMGRETWCARSPTTTGPKLLTKYPTMLVNDTPLPRNCVGYNSENRKTLKIPTKSKRKKENIDGLFDLISSSWHTTPNRDKLELIGWAKHIRIQTLHRLNPRSHFLKWLLRFQKTQCQILFFCST